MARMTCQPVAAVEVQLAVDQHQIKRILAQLLDRSGRVVGLNQLRVEVFLDQTTERAVIHLALAHVEHAFHRVWPYLPGDWIAKT